MHKWSTASHVTIKPARTSAQEMVTAANFHTRAGCPGAQVTSDMCVLPDPDVTAKSQSVE